MNFYVMTLFPEMIDSGTSESIIGRARKNGLVSVRSVNIRDYAEEKRHGRIDDYPYGGGAGMVMQAKPVCDCCESVRAMIDQDGGDGKTARVIYLTPQGRRLDQKMAQSLADERDLILLCGHYEGVDERALELIGTENVSIGDYVLTGGELGGDESALIETFHDNLLEYPQYTRPEEYMGLKVPDILLSGHHENVDKWRRERSIERTFRLRPDLLSDASLTKKEQKFLASLKEQSEGNTEGF